ncbi:hypothetical protein F4778DRAFT_48686 [Xylariomycetidae sp. FL2044]|nr:hypothetical protein F4778DRAFT_48686 [Xylariomycetidae sp. FL2044]
MADSNTSTLFKDVTIITVDKSRRVILKGYLLITGSRIAHISSQPPASLPENTRMLSLPGRIIIPGLINTHAHLAQSLLRGLAEDLPLHDWLCDRIWPLEAAYGGEGDASDGYVAARLTIAEMLLGGTTCFLEAMLTHGSGFGNVARAVSEMGIRACLGKLVKAPEKVTALSAHDARDKDMAHMSLASLFSAHASHHGSSSDRIHVWAALGTPRGAPLASFAAIGGACRERGIGLTMHCAEAPRDPAIFRAMYAGRSPMQFCDEAGLLAGHRTVLAHMCHLDPEVDVPILRRHSGAAAVAHNPTSNLKLASGVADVPRLREGGVNVALGTDGAPCNNSYDMLREMHLASVLHKGVRLDAKQTLGAHEALEMATVHGARALGLEEAVGSLEVGKKADLAVLDVRGCWAAPWDPAAEDGKVALGMDPVSLVVGSCTGRDVSHVLVDGKMLVEDGRLVCADEGEIARAARTAVRGIQKRSGVLGGRKDGWVYE